MSLNICSIGDIMLGENVHHFGRGIATRYDGNFKRLIPPVVRAAASTADLVVGNLECSLMPDRDRRHAPLARSMYAAPESALDCFSGFDAPIVLNVANNHFGQHGRKAMDYTLACLRERGIHVIGRHRAPVELEVNGRRVRFWGASLVEDGQESGGYVRTSPETLFRDLDFGRPDGACRVVSLHWGTEYRTLPTPAQKRLARMLAARGVDLILGHHPHVVQPVEIIDGVPAAYSHGNFLFDQNFSRLTRTGLMLRADLEGGGLRIWLTRCREYRIVSMRQITLPALESWCRKRRNRFRPGMMRILMKLEMLADARHVPDPVWRHFFGQLMAKARAGKKQPRENRAAPPSAKKG